MPKLILTVIDGCRLDALEKTATPNLDRLREHGFSAPARSVSPSITLPVHFSIFTSLSPSNHGVLTNTADPTPSPAAISLIDWAKRHGLSTAALYNWEHLRNLSTPGCLDYSLCLPGGDDRGDERLTTAVIDLIRSTGPDFIFLYLGWLDAVGHDHGWMSEPYLAALSRADDQIGQVMNLILDPEQGHDYNLMVLSDHGGQGKSHEEPLAEVLAVPFMAAGPGIVNNAASTAPISLLDVAPTAIRLLGLPDPGHFQGRVVEQALA